MADDRAVEADDLDRPAVGPRRRMVHHHVPPCVAEIVLELHAERAVVPEAVDAAIDLGRLEDEAAPLAERHQALHEGGAGRAGHERDTSPMRAGRATPPRRSVDARPRVPRALFRPQALRNAAAPRYGRTAWSTSLISATFRRRMR